MQGGCTCTCMYGLCMVELVRSHDFALWFFMVQLWKTEWPGDTPTKFNALHHESCPPFMTHLQVNLVRCSRRCLSRGWSLSRLPWKQQRRAQQQRRGRSLWERWPLCHRWSTPTLCGSMDWCRKVSCRTCVHAWNEVGTEVQKFTQTRIAGMTMFTCKLPFLLFWIVKFWSSIPTSFHNTGCIPLHSSVLVEPQLEMIIILVVQQMRSYRKDNDRWIPYSRVVKRMRLYLHRRNHVLISECTKQRVALIGNP